MEETKTTDVVKMTGPLIQREKNDFKLDLEFMRDLFENKLPVGEDTSNIKNFFNHMEELIYTKEYENYVYEKFPESVDLGGRSPEYTYHSPRLIRQQGRVNDILDDRQIISSGSEHSPERYTVESDTSRISTSPLSTKRTVSS